MQEKLERAILGTEDAACHLSGKIQMFFPLPNNNIAIF